MLVEARAVGSFHDTLAESSDGIILISYAEAGVCSKNKTIGKNDFLKEFYT